MTARPTPFDISADVKTSTRPGTAEPLYTRIAANLRQEILDGALQSGQRLREQEVAERYGVSRVPVREAFRRLEVERLVDVLPNRGAFVTVVTAKEVSELLNVRLTLEELIVREAAEHRTDAELAELREICDRGQRSIRGARPSDLVELNTEFHQSLGRASHNSTAVGLVEQLRARIELIYAGKLPRRAESSWKEHAAILDGIAASDVDRAGAALRSHLLLAASAWPTSVTPS